MNSINVSNSNRQIQYTSPEQGGVAKNDVNTDQFLSYQKLGSGSSVHPSQKHSVGSTGAKKNETHGTHDKRTPPPLGDFKQGKANNCFLLAAIKSMCMDADGLRAFDQMVIPGSHGSYTVQFLGARGEVFTVTAKDIAAARAAEKCSTGDDRVAAMEIAAARKLGHRIDDGGYIEPVLELLLGENAFGTENQNKFRKAIRLINKDGDGISITAGADVDPNGNMAPRIYGNGHAFIITGYDPDSKRITYINPRDTSIVRTISQDKFLEYAFSMTYAEVGQNTADEAKVAAKWKQINYGERYTYV